MFFLYWVVLLVCTSFCVEDVCFDFCRLTMCGIYEVQANDGTTHIEIIPIEEEN